VVRARFLARPGCHVDGPAATGPLPTAAVLALGGLDAPSPALPDWVARWVADQAALRAARPGPAGRGRAAPVGAL